MDTELRAAITHHENGQLEEAARAYERILARDAANADALHLRGVLAYQQRDLPYAVELIGRAIALSPGNAAYHCNLGEVHRALGQLDRAQTCCQQALSLQ